MSRSTTYDFDLGGHAPANHEGHHRRSRTGPRSAPTHHRRRAVAHVGYATQEQNEFLHIHRSSTTITTRPGGQHAHPPRRHRYDPAAAVLPGLRRRDRPCPPGGLRRGPLPGYRAAAPRPHRVVPLPAGRLDRTVARGGRVRGVRVDARPRPARPQPPDDHRHLGSGRVPLDRPGNHTTTIEGEQR